MRKAGYPDYRRSFQVAFNLATNITPDGTATEAPPLQKLDQFHFSDLENTSGFVLLANALAFQTTAYETFEQFSTEMRRGLEILTEAVGGLSFVERVGLRYLDAVVPTSGENINQYLASEVLGLPAKMIDHKFAYSFAESTLQVDGIGQVIARTIIQNSSLTLPPDLNVTQLKVAERFRSFTGEHAVLDTDGSLIARKPFDLDGLQRSLIDIHGLIVEAFHAMTTDHARAIWNERGEK